MDPRAAQVDTHRVEGDEPAHGGRLELVLLDEGAASPMLLPPEGTLVIGRAEDAAVRIESPSVSRRHAALHLGKTAQLEDLGSANGTRVRGARLDAGVRVDVRPGDAIVLGSVRCVLQGREVAPRRVAEHAYFTARLDDECRRGGAFAVARLRLDPPPDDLDADALLDVLGPHATIAARGPWEFEALLADVAPDVARAAARRMAACVARSGRVVELGVACFPVDARTVESLLARAGELRAWGGVSGAAPDDIVIADPAMRALHEKAAQVARTAMSVLLLGETGVGKEVFAARLHRLSPRASGPFVCLNCATLPEALAESELFGHERGAFTHAVSARPGIFEAADRGTVFLDEVGELSTENQARLLRVLQDRQVRRVGATRTVAVDVRVVAATNHDLEAEVEAGAFRRDLYYRLNGITLTIPPLRQRVAELEALAQRFADAAWRSARWPGAAAFAPEAREALRAHAWPGNIRELCNVVERAVALCGGATIAAHHLDLTPAPTASTRTAPPPRDLTPEERSDRARVLDALERCLHNQTHAARMLGIARRTLINKIERYDLPRPRKG